MTQDYAWNASLSDILAQNDMELYAKNEQINLFSLDGALCEKLSDREANENDRLILFSPDFIQKLYFWWYNGLKCTEIKNRLAIIQKLLLIQHFL